MSISMRLFTGTWIFSRRWITKGTSLLRRLSSIHLFSFIRGDRFSRSCSRCSIPYPNQRFVSTHCGHTICSDCAEWTNQCNICHSSSHFILLIEDSNRSRHCSNCSNEFPHERSVFSVCGHSICCACAYQINFEASITSLPIVCSHCKKESDIIHLIEEVISNHGDNLYTEIDDSSLSSSPSTIIAPIHKSPFRKLAHYVIRKLRKFS